MKRNLLVLLPVLAVLLFAAHLVLSWVAQKAQASGTSHAIAGAMQSETKNPDSKIAVMIAELLGTNETIELNATQYDAMVDILVAQKRQLDVPQPWKPGMKLNDPWGNRFRIIVQQIDSNQPPIITVTNHHR